MKKAILLVLALVPGCKKDHQIGGVGRWNVEKTTRKDADGACVPDGAGIYCSNNAPLGIKGMHADIDLYFPAQDPDSKVSEIQLKVDACDQDDLTGWLKSNFGAVAEDKGNRKMWKNDFLWVVGDLPLADEPMECIVRVIPKREQARFDKVWP